MYRNGQNHYEHNARCVQLPTVRLLPFICQIQVQSSTEQKIAIITLHYCVVCSISCSFTSYPALMFRPSSFFPHLSSKFSSQLAVPRHRLSVLFPYGVRPSSRHLKCTVNKIILFHRNTTPAYSRHHPSMATCSGLF